MTVLLNYLSSAFSLSTYTCHVFTINKGILLFYDGLVDVSTVIGFAEFMEAIK